MMGQRVLVGVTGGIAAYKSAQLVSLLVQQGAEVQVVMTEAAGEFIGAATFAALAGRPVATSMFDAGRFPLGAHIELARWGTLMIVAPCTADFLDKAAHGAADDLLSALYLCFQRPVLMAPAMNTSMWRHVAVQRNVAQLVADGVHMVGPDSGWLSCRDEGPGRMSEPASILAAAAAVASAGNADEQPRQ